MRYRPLLSPSIFLTLFLVAAHARGNESTTHRVTSGTFGVAWIASEGLVYTFSPTQEAAPFRVNHLRAHQLAAIDYDADGRDELAIIDALNKSLFVYDFDEQTMIGGFGSNVSEITVGRFDPEEPFESLIATTYTGHCYRWSREIGNQGWLPLPGDFVKAYRGRVVSRIKTDRFCGDQEESTLVRGDERVTRASWAAYTAPLDGGEPATAVVFSHPDNFRPMYAFTMGDNSIAFAFLSATLNLYREPFTWENDEKVYLRWGIALLDGNPSSETIAAVYAYWKSKEK